MLNAALYGVLAACCLARIDRLGPLSGWSARQRVRWTATLRLLSPGLLALAVAFCVGCAIDRTALDEPADATAWLGAAVTWTVALLIRRRLPPVEAPATPSRTRASRAARRVAAAALVVLLADVALLPPEPGQRSLTVLAVAAGLALVAAVAVFWLESWRPTQAGAPRQWPAVPRDAPAPAATGSSADGSVPGGADGRAGGRAQVDAGMAGPFTTRRSRRAAEHGAGGDEPDQH